MMMKRMSIFLFAIISGCASYRPIVDMRGQSQEKYESDLSECQQYAQQAVGPGTGAAVGAVAGALLGFLVNRAAGFNYDAGAGARAGGVLGAAGGAAGGADNERSVIVRCMQGRGFNVLQ